MQFEGYNFFQCPGYTIPRKFKCDGINNCGDNSDEEDCPSSGNHSKPRFLIKYYRFNMFQVFLLRFPEIHMLSSKVQKEILQFSFEPKTGKIFFYFCPRDIVLLWV